MGEPEQGQVTNYRVLLIVVYIIYIYVYVICINDMNF